MLVFDTETTGLLKHEDAALELQPHAIEIGAALLSLETGELVGELSGLIRPPINLDPEITKITGLTDADLAGQLTFAETLPTIEAFFRRGTVVVAHNLPFDKGIIHNELRRLGGDAAAEFPWPAQELCTVGLFRETWGRNPRLIELYESILGRKYDQTHRGMDDVRALVEIIQHERLWELFK